MERSEVLWDPKAGRACHRSSCRFGAESGNREPGRVFQRHQITATCTTKCTKSAQLRSTSRALRHSCLASSPPRRWTSLWKSTCASLRTLISRASPRCACESDIAPLESRQPPASWNRQHGRAPKQPLPAPTDCLRIFHRGRGSSVPVRSIDFARSGLRSREATT
jgi:hypothetical protein